MDFLYIVWDGANNHIPIGSFKLHFYSLMWLAAFLLGFQIMKKLLLSEPNREQLLDSLFIYVAISTILGARLGEFFYNPENYLAHPLEIFLPIQYAPGSSAVFGLIKDYEFSGFRGLASHGATIGLLIGIGLYCRKFKLNYLWLMDRFCIPVAIGGALIRIGNFFNAEMVGRETNVPWAIIFKNHSYGAEVPRHPGQLYEAIGYILIFILVWYLFYKTDKKKYLGYIFGLFFICLWTVRIFVEMFKEDQGTEALANYIQIGLNNGQLLSIPFLLAGIYIFVTAKNRKVKEA